MKKNFIALFLISLLILAGCKQEDNIVPEQTLPQGSTEESQISYSSPDAADMFSERDFETDYQNSSCSLITLNGNSASGAGVTIDGSTITITKEGSYILSGQLENGMVIVETDKKSKVQLIFDGIQIHSATSAPIYIKQADKVFITLSDGSFNSLSSGESFLAIDENNIDAVIFSKEDLTLNGNGSLAIHSPAGHGIVSKDDLRITSGNYTITSSGHGLSGNDAVSIAAGNFTVECEKDGIHAENNEDTSLGTVYIVDGTFYITTEGDGISANSTMHLCNGEYTITCGGGSEYGKKHTDDMFGGGMGGPGGMRPGGRGLEGTLTPEEGTPFSAKGLKSTGPMSIIGGNYVLNCADDAVHSNDDLTVAGGVLQIATGDDGFHADEALKVLGGIIQISESYEGLEGLSIAVRGGEIILKASDDGFNAAGGNDQSGFGEMGGRPGGMGGFGQDNFGSSSDSFIDISGGMIRIDADGDGIDSNGNLTISGGYTVVEGPTNNGNGPLDYGGNGILSGGTVIISGSSGMAQTLNTASTQGILAINVGSCRAGTEVLIYDDNDNQILSVVPQKLFQCIIVSTPEMIKGELYTLKIGEIQQEFEA